MAVSKYWGDERQSGAIYAVYLKKVRYVPPQQFEGLPHYRPIDPDSHHLTAELDGSDHLQWETLRERIIKAGTLEKLVESLINSEDQRMDSRQYNVFFATFRAFAEPEAVLNKFINWFETTSTALNTNTASGSQESKAFKSAQTLQNSIRSMLICWLETYPEDFYPSTEEKNFYLLNQLIDFARSRNLYDLKHKARKVRERFKRIAKEGGLLAQIPSISRYSYANTICYDPHDYGYAQHRAQMFDISRDNCVQIAEQLTFWDAVLFRELRPYQCQGAIWGKRHKKSADAVFSVRATIDQFNAVSQRVMTSIVFPECQPEFRAKIIEKWIEIAKELRLLKNFSSLKAVLSSLQSEPVYRLKSTWSIVSKTSALQFKELAATFDNDDNGNETKTKLEAKETTKSSPFKRSQNIQNCRRTKSDVNLAESQGTVPFLGSFLTELTMIDQAHFDNTAEGLINFEKRRREFEVLAKIRLFQSAARAYTVPMDQAFCIWFYYLPSLNEKECFTRSLEIEPISTLSPDSQRRLPKNSSNGNSFYSSPSTSVSKFHSLTKMFTNINTNDTQPNVASSTPNSAQCLHRLQPASSSFTGQRSNDSGIHTEENFTNADNDIVSTASSSNKLLGTPSSLQNSARHTNINSHLVSDEADEFRSSTAPTTPAGTLSKCSKTNAIENGGMFAGSEFNPYLHFNGHAISRKPLADDSFSKFQNSNQKSASRSSTPVRSVHAKQSTNLVELHSSQSSNSLNAVDGMSTQHPNNMLHFSNNPNGHQTKQKSNSSLSSCSSYGSMASPMSIAGNGGGNLFNGRNNNTLPPLPSLLAKDFHLARVGLDDSIQNESVDIATINYKCIKVGNGDRMAALIERALEKHMIDVSEKANYCLAQLLPDGSEFKLPDNCNPFYAVAPDPTSPMLNFLLKKRANTNFLKSSNGLEAAPITDIAATNNKLFMAPSAKKLNRQKRSNLLRWSSGFL